VPAKVDSLVLRVEAVLFASGKPQSVHELAGALGLDDHRPVQRALRLLTRAYDGRQTALEVRHVGERYALQLRTEYVAAVQSVTPVELPPRTLKALTLIAYHQPMLQSLLARMLGEAAYEEVVRLRELHLIQAEPKGATLELRTTRAFVEYFGIPSTDPVEIRKFLTQKLGISATDLPPAPAEDTSAPEGAGAPTVDAAGSLVASTPISSPAPDAS
jgi:segregation and condensation protein B